MIQLRYYQRDACDAVYDYWSNGGGNPLVEMATGTGKSLVNATLSKELIEFDRNIRILSLVHTRELVRQNASELMSLWPQAPLGINSAGLGMRNRNSQIIIGSIQSLYKCANKLGPRDVIIADECHLWPRDGEGMYRSLLTTLRTIVPDLRVVGLTATGYRLDSGRLDEGKDCIFDETVYQYDLARGVEDGYLSPLISPAMETEIDVSRVKKVLGDFAAKGLEEAASRNDVVDAACDELVRYGHDRRGWLVFCSGVQHAAQVCYALQRRNILCATINGETPSGERDNIIRAFSEGRLRALTNAQVLTTGFNVKHIDLVALLTSTLSTSKYVQMLGRGTRLSPGKNECIVCDFGGNVRRHGPVDAVNVRSKKKGQSLEKTEPSSIRAKLCPSCTVFNTISALTCTNCAYQWPEPPARHGAVVEALPVMMREIVNKWIKVNDILINEHHKEGKPPSMKVIYVCGITTYNEWVCFEHTGVAKGRATAWWRAMGGAVPFPKTTDEAIQRTDELAIAHEIMVIKDGEWWRVLRYRLERDGVVFEVDERLTARMVELTT